MGIVLGPNRYGKAEVRLVRVVRDDATHHRLADLTVSIALSGDLAATHLVGDNAHVLPTDSMRALVFAFAREEPDEEPEEFALRLARHLTTAYEPVHTAQVRIHAHPWERIAAAEGPHPHAWTRAAGSRYAGAVRHADGGEQVVSGLDDVTVLKSTGSEFHGFLTDRYTTLEPTDDRVLATSVSARWRHAARPEESDPGADWTGSYEAARTTLLRTFADTHSLSLQQTLYAMGKAVLAEQPRLAEVRLELPNKHHFLVDLAPYGHDNPGEVYYAADRPYGLIEGTVLRDDAIPAMPELPW
ncbi:factor-independent urate hydroxylase [Uniformispora flossi]|uniref:factor-independent urate hydroxylase n=1 Tax=Uniformispora flossi TaxID=3390723 RepID=UPI003C2C34C2